MCVWQVRHLGLLTNGSVDSFSSVSGRTSFPCLSCNFLLETDRCKWYCVGCWRSGHLPFPGLFLLLVVIVCPVIFLSGSLSWAPLQPCSLSSWAGDGWTEALQVLGPLNRSVSRKEELGVMVLCPWAHGDFRPAVNCSVCPGKYLKRELTKFQIQKMTQK